MKSTEAKEKFAQAPDLRGAEAALRRAAQRAKEKAEAHGLKVLIYKKEQPNTICAGDEINPGSQG